MQTAEDQTMSDVVQFWVS